MIIPVAGEQPGSVRTWVLIAGTVSGISQASLILNIRGLRIRIRWRNSLGRFLWPEGNVC